MTSSINPDDAKRADRMGVNEYITKPMHEDTLRGMLVNVEFPLKPTQSSY